MHGLAGAVGALMIVLGFWALWVAPSAIMSQLPVSLQVFFAVNVWTWIAAGLGAFLWSVLGGPNVK